MNDKAIKGILERQVEQSLEEKSLCRDIQDILGLNKEISTWAMVEAKYEIYRSNPKVTYQHMLNCLYDKISYEYIDPIKKAANYLGYENE